MLGWRVDLQERYPHGECGGVMSCLGLSQTHACVAGSTLFFFSSSLFVCARRSICSSQVQDVHVSSHESLCFWGGGFTASHDCVIPDGESASSLYKIHFQKSGGQWCGQFVHCKGHASPDRLLGSQGSTRLAYRIGTPGSLILTSSGSCCNHLLLTHLQLQELLRSTSGVQAV